MNSCRNELKQHLKVERNENTEARGRSGRGWVGHEASSSRGGLGSHGQPAEGCYSLATDPGIPRDTEGGGRGAPKVFNRHQPGSVVLSG